MPSPSRRASRLPAPAIGLCVLLILPVLGSRAASGGQLMAGAAKVDITDREAGPVNDPLYVKAVVIRSGRSARSIAATTIGWSCCEKC